MGITPFTDSDDSCGFLPTYIMLLHISSWLTANLLTLNSSKTELLFIVLKQKLGNIHNSLLNTETKKNDFILIFGMRGYTPKTNHPCQISSRLVKGFGVYGL